MHTFLLVSLVALSAQAAALPKAVVYLPQTEALCGGAAAAMVMRYWGDASIRPEDFEPLIDRAQEGIVTTVLVDDLRRRGWQAFPLRGDAGFAPVVEHLTRGRPIVALIEDRPSRYHYVVVTAVDRDSVTFHDPAVAPSQTMTRREFARRWQAANYWMLLLTPTGSTERAEGSVPSDPLELRVAALLRSGELAEAHRLSTAATLADPRDAVAWDALATTLFVMDRELEALEAWTRAGKPDVDTVQIGGLRQTRYRAAERMIGIAPGDRLTRARLERARRRLDMLPSAASSRVSYVPLADGRVQIDAAIAERSRLPGLFELAVAGAKAPFSRDVGVSLTNLVGGGERVTASWRFREGFERLEAAIEAPSPLPLGAVWKISGFESRETYAIHGARSESEWRRAAFQASDWLNGRAGWTIGAGVERWPGLDDGARDDKAYVAGRMLLAAGEAFDGHVTVEGWIGGSGATRASTLGRLAFDAGGGRATLTAGMEGVHGNTPAFLFPGAGDGNTRAPLLRAHPLIQDDAIRVDAGRIFGRRLFYGTAEWTRPLARVFFALIDGAAFLDAAHGRQLLDGRLSDTQADAGLGLRIRAAGGPTFRLDIARGLVDGRWALTAGTVVGLGHWIQ